MRHVWRRIIGAVAKNDSYLALISITACIIHPFYIERPIISKEMLRFVTGARKKVAPKCVYHEEMPYSTSSKIDQNGFIM